MNIIKSLVIVMLSLSACESADVANTNDLPLFVIDYKPNQCAEKWDDEKYTTNPKTTRDERLIMYLKENGITEVLEFTNKKDNKVNCLACNCPSNDNLSFKVSQNNYDKIKTIEPFKTILAK
jgi:hypothetical protein